LLIREEPFVPGGIGMLRVVWHAIRGLEPLLALGESGSVEKAL
jgi:hypothetical protein